MGSSAPERQVASLKKSTLSEAREVAIAVENSAGEPVELLPVGGWILEEWDLISLMTSWRGKAMMFFFHQFEATDDSMRNYLESYAIEKPNRILFLIFVGGIAVGHIGLSDIKKDSAEVDNMIRGSRLGPISLMLDVERRLLSWAIDELSLRNFWLRIQSRNVLAKRLHEELGFTKTESLPLRRLKGGGRTFRLEPCTVEDCTETFKMDIMALKVGVSHPEWLTSVCQQSDPIGGRF